MRSFTRLHRMAALLLACLLFFTACNTTTNPSEDGIEPVKASFAERWALSLLESEDDFVSCLIGGEPLSERETERTLEKTEQEETDTVVYTITRKDKESGLVFVTTLLLFRSSNALEVSHEIRNDGSEKSPVISELYVTDIDIPLASKTGITIKTTRGCGTTSVDDDYDFGELSYQMGVGSNFSFAPEGGRSCNQGWPYFDLVGANGGCVVAIGWTGQWQADFATIPGGVSMKAGQQYFNAYLKTGESVKTPSVTMMFYDGSSEDGRNDFRQLYLNYYTPENVKDESFVFPISSNIGYTPSDVKATLTQLTDNLNLKNVCIWQDAGWYGEDKEDWNSQVGNWYPNEDLGEAGMKETGELIHQAGYRYILWYELERAQPDSQMGKEHRELYYDLKTGSGYLLRLDTDEGYDWMFSMLCHGVEEYGMDIYRQDFNLNPLQYWLDNDDADRVGITENKYINNLYRMMDELLAKYPELVIDNCASGGRRLDIAMMKRCISLFRTDYSCTDNCKAEGVQYHQQNLLSWLPLTAAGIRDNVQDPYVALSATSVGMIVGSYAKWTAELTYELQPYYRGNYYNLLQATFDDYSHQAWELFDPDTNTGFALAFARPKTEEGMLKIKLKGLDPNMRYTVTLHGADEPLVEKTGKELMEKGIEIYLRPRSAKLLMIAAVESETTVQEGETT